MEIVYRGGGRFTKFWLKDLFTNELVECSEKDFDDIVTRHRSLYELKWQSDNVQLFLIDGVVEAKRQRGE